MVQPTFKQLRYFQALARYGHFGRAAEACAISQPALSVQIRDLEDMLGAPLFERGPRQVALTGFGEDFAARARDILRAVDELGDVARAARDRLVGRLRLGVIPTVAPYLLPALLAALDRSHPDMRLNVRETLTARLIDEIHAGDLDAAIVALPVSEPGLTEVPLAKEDLVLIRQATAPGPQIADLSGLSTDDLLLLEEGHCFRDQALAFCGTGGAARTGFGGSSLATLVQLVGAGLGVTLIPEMAIAVETRSAPVAVARFPDPAPSRTLGMIWRATTPLAAQLSGVADTIRVAAQDGRGADAPAHAGAQTDAR